MATACGSILQDKGKFGFIKQDGSEVDMFVMTPRDGPFAGALPPVGTRVIYDIVIDGKTGKPRAENLQPEAANTLGEMAWPPTQLETSAASSIYGEMAGPAAAIERVLQAHEVGGSSCTGAFLKNSGNFGFIKQDSGEEDMFVLPPSCQAFGGAFPPIGTRVIYEVVVDGKTGRLRAENVQPEGGAGAAVQGPMEMEAASRSSPVSTPRGESAWNRVAEAAGHVQSGTMLKSSGNFGFISQDSGKEDMFVIPPSCLGFNGCLPPIGTRVLYEVVTDGKTGRPRAENVQPQVAPRHRDKSAADKTPQPSPRIQLDQAEAEVSPMDGGSFEMRIGTMLKDNGNFGFIQQDNGEEDMFVMPPSCAAFGGALPPPGTRLVYEVVTDSKTGRPRAENVRPESTALSDLAQQAFDQAALQTGMFVQNKGNFGFIRQDSGQEDMFVMPPSCEGFGGILPPIGSRVQYEVVEDAKTGRPRAEKVHPEGLSTSGSSNSWAQPQLQKQSWTPQFPAQRAHAAAAASAPPALAAIAAAPGGTRSGTLTKNNGNFGFIQQDCGEDDMFVMPPSCAGFGGHLPPIGTRVTYGVVPDAKSGRPRAENVQPEVPITPRLQSSAMPESSRSWKEFMDEHLALAPAPKASAITIAEEMGHQATLHPTQAQPWNVAQMTQLLPPSLTPLNSSSAVSTASPFSTLGESRCVDSSVKTEKELDARFVTPRASVIPGSGVSMSSSDVCIGSGQAGEEAPRINDDERNRKFVLTQLGNYVGQFGLSPGEAMKFFDGHPAVSVDDAFAKLDQMHSCPRPSAKAAFSAGEPLPSMDGMPDKTQTRPRPSSNLACSPGGRIPQSSSASELCAPWQVVKELPLHEPSPTWTSGSMQATSGSAGSSASASEDPGTLRRLRDRIAHLRQQLDKGSP